MPANSNRRRILFGAMAAAILLAPLAAEAAATVADAEKFIENLGGDAISSLTGTSLSEDVREQRFKSLLEAYFDLPGGSKFVLGRYWKVASEAERADFQRLFEKLLAQSYAKTFAQYAGERFQVTGGRIEDDSSFTVNSHIDRPNGDVIHLDWRIEDQAGRLRITDFTVEGISLRITHRSDIASAIQSEGGQVSALLEAMRQKTGSP
ncbi:MAG TPA: ABC transporter substrate-binding protein [Candidatus Udaeobacter sp.]|nr:ABC transporter substrate-binding protein [Candidatus Udaeobacter sp.]